jgi:hypothetical protein
LLGHRGGGRQWAKFPMDKFVVVTFGLDGHGDASFPVLDE